MNHVSRLIVLFLSRSLTTKGQKPMDPVTLPTAGSAAVAVSVPADPLAWHRDRKDTGREDGAQGRFSANQTNEDPPISRRDEGTLGGSTKRAPQDESDDFTEPRVMTLQMMMQDEGATRSRHQSEVQVSDEGW